MTTSKAHKKHEQAEKKFKRFLSRMIKDEIKGYLEYKKAGFKGIAKDEKRHKTILTKIKKRMK